ncbi:hypothetical protein [Azospirillum sp. sgz302134]
MLLLLGAGIVFLAIIRHGPQKRTEQHIGVLSFAGRLMIEPEAFMPLFFHQLVDN